MGLTGQVKHPKVQEAVKTVKDMCIKKNIPVGIFVGNADGAVEARKNNFSLIGVGIDWFNNSYSIRDRPHLKRSAYIHFLTSIFFRRSQIPITRVE